MSISGHLKSACAAIVCTVLLIGCEEAQEVKPEPIRAIKPFYVAELAGGSFRDFTGSIVASGTSALSFSVGGTIQEINVNAGDTVKAGQILAKIDPKLYQLDVDAAQSQLDAARSNQQTQKANLDRQKELFNKGWVAKAAYDQAELSFESAANDVRYAQSRLASAKRNLNNTTLLAPYDGNIANRSAEPFSEITPGSAILEINAKGALELAFNVPSNLISRFNIGQTVTIDTDETANCGCNGRITEIGSTSGAANSVIIKAGLVSPPPGLIPGMTSTVRLNVQQDGEGDGYLVPLNAIAASEDEKAGYIYRFDPATQTVNRIKVVGTAGRDNMVQVKAGLKAGDIIAAAGVSFLRDGQKVKLLGE